MILRPGIVGIYVKCATCERQKQPVGRDSYTAMCDENCPGYFRAPKAGQLWPGESEKQFGHPVGNDGSQRGDDDDLATD